MNPSDVRLTSGRRKPLRVPTLQGRRSWRTSQRRREWASRPRVNRGARKLRAWCSPDSLRGPARVGACPPNSRQPPAPPAPWGEQLLTAASPGSCLPLERGASSQDTRAPWVPGRLRTEKKTWCFHLPLKEKKNHESLPKS